MRLICPNCGAQYEVPDDVIPETGRDVQCSNCGDTWFQKHPDHDPDLAEELGQPLDEAHWDDADEPFVEDETAAEAPPPADELPETAWSDEHEAAPAPDADETGDETGEAAPDDETDDKPEADWFEPGPDLDEEPEEADALDAPGHDDLPPQRELAPELRDMLREEAEREREARAADTGALETQTDLGLDEPSDDASRREREARLRMARMRGASEKEAMSAAGLSQLAANASRRDLLPDIEEINSTLRKDSERQATAEPSEAPAAAPARRGGFSRGFSVILLFFALALALYVFAGKLAEMVPQLEPLLSAYVEMVNRGRFWLDGQIAALMQWLDTMSSEAPPPES